MKLSVPTHLMFFNNYDQWQLNQDVAQWLEFETSYHKIYPDLFNTNLTIFFRDEIDAVHFKMRWF